MNGARIAFGFAESVLDDMNNFDTATSAAYHTPLALTLNDTFTRAFAGDVMDVNKKGGERVAPELLSKKLSVGGSDAFIFASTKFKKLVNLQGQRVLKGLTRP